MFFAKVCYNSSKYWIFVLKILKMEIFMKKMNILKMLLLGVGILSLASVPVYAEEATGEEWDGVIYDRAVEKKEEPAPKTETQTPKQEAKPAATTKKTTKNTTKTVKKSIDPEGEEPDISEFNPEALSVDDDIFAETETSEEKIEVPVTATPRDNTVKIRIMAAIATAIVVFGVIFLFSGVKLFELHQIEKFFK